MASSVRPNVQRLTDADARHLLADGLIRACSRHGPSRVALETGCDEKTIRRARDEESTLGLACVFNLLDVDDHALDALAASKGFRLAKLSLGIAPDVVAASGAVLHKIGLARSPDGPGGTIETDDELRGMEGDLSVLEAATASLQSRIAMIKLRKAAA